MPVKWLSKNKCMALLKNTVYGRLATCSQDGKPYITQLNYVLHDDKIYFHTGFKGRKLDNIKENDQICFEISAPGKMYATPHARNFTMRFWSVLVFGKAKEVKDTELKFKVMNLLMEKYAKGFEYEPLSREDMDIVNVVEISIDDISGKTSIDPN